MEKASFSLIRYSFDKVNIDYTKKNENGIRINFDPTGLFKQNDDKSEYKLRFIFTATNNEGSENPFVKIECNALFEFSANIGIEDIPEYFYVNSIAIIFPYIRAFVSTITLQSNYPALILPTMNLMSLAEPLKENTKEN